MMLDKAIGTLEYVAMARGDIAAGDPVPVAVAQIRAVVNELLDALESTTWSSGCWCRGKDPRGHSATCAARQAAMVMAGRELVILPRARKRT